MRRRTRHNPPASTTATIAGIAGAVAVVMGYRYFSQRAYSAPPPPPPPPPQGGLQNNLPASGFSLTVNPADAGTLTIGPSGEGFKQYLVGVASLDPRASLAPVVISVEGLPVGLVAQVAYATGATGAAPTMPATVKVMATEGVTPAPGPVRLTIVGTSPAGRATVAASLTVAAAPARSSGIPQTDTLPMPALYGRNIVDMTGLRRGNQY